MFFNIHQEKVCAVQVMWFSRKGKRKKQENNNFYTQNHNLLKIQK